MRCMLICQRMLRIVGDGRRGEIETPKRLGSDNGRWQSSKEVSRVRVWCRWEYKWLCYFNKIGFSCLTWYSTLFFILSTINSGNKTTSKKEIIKTICGSVNHTRFPKEDHLPAWARRDNKVMKGDRLEFLEWEVFQTKIVKKIKTHMLYSITCFFFSKIMSFIK